MTPEQTGWIAGFLEGEGYFSQATCSIQVKQVNAEPLEKLVGLVGGVIYRAYTENCTQAWHLAGNDAAELAAIIRPLMSAKRQAQIGVMLTIWESAGLRKMIRAARRFGAEVA